MNVGVILAVLLNAGFCQLTDVTVRGKTTQVAVCPLPPSAPIEREQLAPITPRPNARNKEG